MSKELIQIITAAIGTLGFSIYFRVSEKNVFSSMLGGTLGWAVYLLVFHFTEHMFAANFAATLIVYLYSEISARVLKAPANVFLIPGIIPLLPGNSLYYTMRGLVDGDAELFAESGKSTLIITFGIAAGIVVGAIIVSYFIGFSGKRIRGKRKNKQK